MPKHPVLASYQLESICRTIGDTNNGLTGTEIGQILLDSKIDDTDPALTKWKRLYNAFAHWQNKRQCSNNIIDFLLRALQPVRYVGKQDVFQYRLNEVNKRLSFIGLQISERGTLLKSQVTSTIMEAEQRASHFKHKLEVRAVHSEIYKYCNSELLVENYFHSIFEGVKSVADRLRMITGVHADGNELAEVSFSTKNPLLRINFLLTDTDRNEHIGLMNMIKALFGLIRNPTAHTPKIKFVIEEEEALDIMTVISFVHKKLDKIV
jgi:uncharacterized protein (TIGR02391 family)